MQIVAHRGKVFLTSHYVDGPGDGTYFCATGNTEYDSETKWVEIPDPIEQRLGTTGDRVHALPYVATFREVVPITGTLKTETKYWTQPSDHRDQYCGNRPEVTTQHERDIVYTFRNNPVTPPYCEPSLKQFLTGMATTSALADLRRGLVNAPLIFAERRKTIQLLASKAKVLTSLVRARQSKDLKRYFATRRKDKKKVARDIAGEHLSMLFGVLPLVNDAKGLVDILTQAQTVVITGRGRRAMEESVTTSEGNIPGSLWELPSGYAECYIAQRISKTRYSVRASISVDVTAQAAQSIRDWSFNPIATAYDLVPLSFLSDFISNLGTFLRALDPLLGVTFKTGNVTLWEESTESLDVKGFGQAYSENGFKGQITTSGSGQGSTRALTVTREVLTDYPDPTLWLANNMTWAKAITGVALAIQRYLKPVRSLIKIKPFRYKGPRPEYLPPINYRKPK